MHHFYGKLFLPDEMVWKPGGEVATMLVMSPKASLIPEALNSGAFTAARAAQYGVSRSMLRGQRFMHVHHGAYITAQYAEATVMPANHVEDRALQAARNYAPLLRSGEAFSHTTALLLYRAPVVTTARLHTTLPWIHAPATGRGIQGHRSRQPFVLREALPGVICVLPELALVQCAQMLPFRELVVAIDHLILPRRGLRDRAIVDREHLARYLSEKSARGIARVRAAFEVARVGAESRFETLTRFELACVGLDNLELQVDLVRDDGTWIGRFDLVDRAKRKVVEFDGEQHRLDRVQYLRDEQRLEAVRNAGYTVLRLHAEDFSPRALAATRSKLCAFLGEVPRSVAGHLAKYLAEPYVPR